MIIYTMLSHTTTYLPYQLESLRKYLDGKIVVVQDNTASEGAIQLTKNQIDAWHIDNLINVPRNDRAFYYARGEYIWRWLLDQCPEQYCCIIHGDMFPTKKIDLIGLLNGKMLAGRGYPNGDRVKLGTNWQVWDKSKLQGWDERSWTYPLELVSLYDWTDDAMEVAEKTGIKANCHLEWCEPGWFHLDRMSQWGINKEVDDEKISILHQLFGGDMRIQPEIYEVPKEREATVFEIKQLLRHKDNLERLPQEMQQKVKELQGGCGCHFTPWVRDHKQELLRYLDKNEVAL